MVNGWKKLPEVLKLRKNFWVLSAMDILVPRFRCLQKTWEWKWFLRRWTKNYHLKCQFSKESGRTTETFWYCYIACTRIVYNKNMINEQRLAKWKRSLSLINYSRGDVVDIPAVKRITSNASAVVLQLMYFLPNQKAIPNLYHTLCKDWKCDSHSAHRRIYSGSSGKYWYWCSRKTYQLFWRQDLLPVHFLFLLWVYPFGMMHTGYCTFTKMSWVFLVKSMENYPIWTWTFWDNTSKQIIRLVTLFSMRIKRHLPKQWKN